MKEKKPIPGVEALTSLLLQRKSIRPRFKWPLTLQQATDLLTAAYTAEVQYRHRPMINNSMTENNIRSVAQFLTDPSSKFGLMLCGTCGNGKTTMLHAIQQATNYLTENDYIDNPYGEIGLPIKEAREITQIRGKNYDNYIKIRDRHMLAIDDLGTEPTEVLDYGNVLSPIVDLLEHRYTNQLFTAVTTNLTPKQIREKYSTRIADRFNEMMQLIVYENITYRRNNL